MRVEKNTLSQKNVNIIQTSLGAPKETNCHFPPLIPHPYLVRKSQNTFYLSATTIIYKHSSPKYPLDYLSLSLSSSSESNSCKTHQPFGIPEVCSLPLSLITLSLYEDLIFKVMSWWVCQTSKEKSNNVSLVKYLSNFATCQNPSFFKHIHISFWVYTLYIMYFLQM